MLWAKELKEKTNIQFVMQEGNDIVFACGVDGSLKPLQSVRSNIGHCLWASLTEDVDGEKDCILKTEYIPHVVKRLMEPDIFEPDAGIRTLSKQSRCFDYNSYQNGSIWPHDNGMIIQGFEHWGYKEEARLVRQALVKAFAHFQTPI